MAETLPYLDSTGSMAKAFPKMKSASTHHAIPTGGRMDRPTPRPESPFLAVLHQMNPPECIRVLDTLREVPTTIT